MSSSPGDHGSVRGADRRSVPRASGERRLGDSWFHRQPAISDPLAEPPSAPRPAGHAGWAMAIGLLTGGGGGGAMVFVAQTLAARLGVGRDITLTLGTAVPARVLDSVFGGDARMAGWALAVAVGAVVGALLGVLMRHLLRVVPRLIFGALFAPALWTAAHTLALPRFAPWLARMLPFVPMVVGALAYGLCVSIVPPIRRRVVDP